MMEKTETKKRRRVSLVLGLHILKVSVIIAGAVAINWSCQQIWGWAYGQYAQAAQAVREKLIVREVVREVVPAEAADMDEIIKQVARENGLNANILRAICLQESGEYWNRPDRVRYEPQLLKKINPPASLNEIERQLWSSSVGVAQVIFGLHRSCLGSLAEAMQPYRNLSCAAKILRKNLEAASKFKTPSARLHYALRLYNGDPDLPQTGVYADAVMSRLGGLMLQQMGDGI